MKQNWDILNITMLSARHGNYNGDLIVVAS